MASNYYHHHVTIACMAMVIVLGLGATDAHPAVPINQFCRTSDYKQLCNKMVSGATNWHDATKNAVQSALKEATALQKKFPLIDQALANVSPQSKGEIVLTCRDNVDGAVDNLKGALDFIERNDVGGLNSYLSAAVSMNDCTDATDQFGANLPPVVAKNMDRLTKHVSNCLAVSQQI